MKKHDEGYSLLLVVVVILVLSILSAALMTAAVSNVKGQRASINRMKDKYAAQGEVEMLVAKLSQENTITLSETDDFKTKLAAGISDDYGITVYDINVVIDDVETGDEGETVTTIQYKTFSYKTSGEVEKGSARITYTIEFSGTIGEQEESDTLNNREYTLTTDKVTYETFEISTVYTSEGGDS